MSLFNIFSKKEPKNTEIEENSDRSRNFIRSIAFLEDFLDGSDKTHAANDVALVIGGWNNRLNNQEGFDISRLFMECSKKFDTASKIMELGSVDVDEAQKHLVNYFVANTIRHFYWAILLEDNITVGIIASYLKNNAEEFFFEYFIKGRFGRA